MDIRGHRMPARLRLSLGLSWLALAFLVLLFTAWNILDPEGSLLRWSIQSLPLLAFAPAMLRGRYRAYSWLCLLLVIYLIPALSGAVLAAGAGLPLFWARLALLSASLLLFFAAAFSSRWLQHWLLTRQ